MTRAFLDTNVFLYATGGPHAYRDPCRDLLRRLQRGELQGESSVEVAQEAAHVRFRRMGDRPEAVRIGELVTRSCEIHAVEPADLRLALRLFGAAQGASLRDALHAAMALNRAIPVIVSADPHFDELTGLERLDPVDPGTVRRLLG